MAEVPCWHDRGASALIYWLRRDPSSGEHATGSSSVGVTDVTFNYGTPLGPRRQGKNATTADDRVLEWFEVALLESAPNRLRESVQRRSVHPLDEAAPTLHYYGRCWRLHRVRLR
jgi:hypothetical protein